MKSQIAILTIILLIVSSQISHSTDVSGDVWGEWTAADNPYNVVGDLRVPPGSTLMIGPGCYIEFQGYYQFLVDTSAVLQAIGSEMDSIIFTPLDTSSGWRGFTLELSDSSTYISYSRLQYVKGALHSSVIKSHNSRISIDHNSIIQNDVSGVIHCYPYHQDEIKYNVFAYNTCAFVITKSSNASMSIVGNLFEYNSCGIIIEQFGGEMFVEWNIFRYNNGLVMYSRWSSTEFTRNIVHNNFSDELPSVFFGMDADYLIENNTVCNNISTSFFFPLGYFETEHVPQPTYMINNIFWGNVFEGDSLFKTNLAYITILCSDVQGGWPGGNIDADPLFVDSANGDFHLTADSPCIDAGSPFSPLDPDGTITDMGALYFHQTTGIIQPPPLPREITLYQNYP
ncbi:MAG: hypothetical protein JSU85_10835, partial [Candidatus Zixiibacteriota bacterium]